MLHHFATYTDNGPCVAYHHAALGYSVVVCECTTEQQANSEAARLNHEALVRSLMPPRRAAYYGQRRSVRYFEPDTEA